MRRAARRDDNERDIIAALREIGAAVYQLDRPVDLLVWYEGTYRLIEVKNPDGFNRLTADQSSFLESWPGPVEIVTDAEGAIEVVTR